MGVAGVSTPNMKEGTTDEAHPASPARPARTPRRRTTPLARTASLAATDAHRAAVAGRPCIVCGSEHRVDAAHVVPRALGCGDALCVCPLCRRCHAAYDAGELDVLPYLEPAYRAQLAHAVGMSG